MARVKCTLHNASENINGVAFSADQGAMVSEDIADDVAANFCLIPGYELLPPTSQAPAATSQAPAGETQPPAWKNKGGRPKKVTTDATAGDAGNGGWGETEEEATGTAGMTATVEGAGATENNGAATGDAGGATE